MSLLLLSAFVSSAAAQSNDALLPPAGGYNEPMVHMGQSMYGQLMADRMEYRTGSGAGEVAVDMEGWVGSDRQRLRYRIEGEHAVSEEEGNGDLSVLYGHLFAPFWEVQAGARASGAREPAKSGGELAGFIGIEGTIPYDFEFETSLYVGHRGRVSWSAEAEKEFLFAQRLVLQFRAETGLSSQDSSALGTRWGFNGLETGMRLRYEVHRQFAPYVGVSHALSPTPADEPLGFISNPAFVAGVRAWL